MADFIIERVTPSDTKSLTSIVLNESERIDNISFNVEHEVMFHGKLYAITGNQSIIKLRPFYCLPLIMYKIRLY